MIKIESRITKEGYDAIIESKIEEEDIDQLLHYAVKINENELKEEIENEHRK